MIITLENNQTLLQPGRELISELRQELNTRIEKALFKLTLILSVALSYFDVAAQVANTITPANKVYGLSKFWQEVNYNFAYFNKIDQTAWDSTYRALIPKVQATENDYEYYRLMQKFSAILKDGHTEVLLPAIKGLNFMNNVFGDYLLVLTRVNNKVIIKRTWKKDVERFPLGSEIVEVNGLPTERFIEDSIAPYISASTDYVRKDIASGRLLMGPPGSKFTIKLRKPDGEEGVYSLTHAKPNDSVFYPNIGAYLDEQKRDVVEWKTFPNSITYLALNTFASESKADRIFEAALPSLDKAKGFILDLRNNGGGDDGVAFNILRHFIKDSIILGASSVVRSYDPYLKALGKYVSLSDTAGNSDKRKAWLLYNGYAVYDNPGISRSKIKEGIKRLSVPVVILIGHNTESAAEDFVVAADNQKHIIKIGEPTNGSTGQPYSFDLPGGGYARVCVIKDMYPDGREFVGYGIKPNITVTPTVKDYLENRDVVLKAALKHFETNGFNIKKSPQK